MVAIFFLNALSYPGCRDASDPKKPHRGDGVANIQPSQVNLELAGKNIRGRDPVSLHSLMEPFPGCPQPCHSPVLPNPSPARQRWPPPAPLCHHTGMGWEGGNYPRTHEKNSRKDDSPHGTPQPHRSNAGLAQVPQVVKQPGEKRAQGIRGRSPHIPPAPGKDVPSPLLTSRPWGRPWPHSLEQRSGTVWAQGSPSARTLSPAW